MTEDVAVSTRPALHPDDVEAVKAHVKAMKRRVEKINEAGETETERRPLYAIMHGGRVKLLVEHGEHQGEHPKRLLHAHYPEHAAAGDEPDDVVKVYDPDGTA